jgi:glycosyltransferase involved in cell wall biosynthesis
MSQHQQPDVSLVLPMFNEEQAVATTLRQLLDLFATTLAHYSFEIIVVDDGSSDKSAEQVRQIDSTHIRLVQHPYNIGNGAAVKTGIRQAKGEYILLMDADGQHQPEDIPRLLEHAETYDMVVGARTNESDTAVHRDLANIVYNRLASYICGRPIDDLTSGFRLIRAELAKSLVYLLPNTFSYPSTMTLAVVRGGFSLKYIPIAARKRVGKSKINLLVDGSRFLTIILRIAVFFAPLKVFIPVSLFFFLSGFSWYVYRVFFVGTGFPPISSLFMTTAVVIFLIGLVSEQITYLRYGKES